MPESVELGTEQLSTRKRAKTSEENDEERSKKRSRGRPRLDPKDETAQDRRRTQIRLAQRAYRNRKDTAITTLEQKVKDLEQANEDMGREFMSFYDFVLSQGMLRGAPEVARRLGDATRKFISFTRKSVEETSKDAGNTAPVQRPSEAEIHLQERHRSGSGTSSSESPSDDLAEPNLAEPILSVSGRPAQANLITPPRVDISSQQQQQQQQQHTHQLTPPISLPYEIITLPTAENASFPVYDTQATIPFSHDPCVPAPVPSLPSPDSYAAQERTFGRRLQRATVEAGLRLVSMANPPPHRYAAVFGFCLLFEPREAIIHRLTMVLSMSRRETLNNWKYPFTNLGGAGTFFSNHGENRVQHGIDSMSNELPLGNQGLPEPLKPSEMTGFSMGPFNSETETARDDRIDHRMRMIYKGFEGDFFDADEVETYLRQRGIIIPENADFVDAEIDIGAFDGPPDLRSQMGGGGSNSFFGVSQVPATGPELFSMPSHTTDAGTMWPTDVPTTLAGTSSMTGASLMAPMSLGPLMPDMPPLEAQQFNLEMTSFMDPSYFPRVWPTDPSWMKTKVTIDVNRLVAVIRKWRNRSRDGVMGRMDYWRQADQQEDEIWGT
ncbi:hypothetical protein ACJ41O_007068 [Fusarium nematophilum]